MKRQSTATEPKPVLALGAGPAHLHLITQARALRAQGARLTVLDRNPFWYFPNMATEVLSGFYGLKDFHVDLRALCKRHGADFILDEAVTLLPKQKKVMTKSGRVLTYALASFALGSLPTETEGDVPAEGSFPVCPVHKVLEIRNEIETFLELFPEKRMEIVILGGGPAGVEYAINTAQFMAERRPPAGWRLILLEAKPRLLGGLPPTAIRQAGLALQAHDVELRTQSEVQHVQSNRLVLDHGETLEFDLAIVATGGRINDIFNQAGFETDARGALPVERTLRLRTHPELFATGDCARVFGIAERLSRQSAARQGPVLAHNLLASLHGRPLRPWQPRFRPWQIISLGSREALAVKDRWALSGRWVAGLKHWLDRKYIRRFQHRGRDRAE